VTKRSKRPIAVLLGTRPEIIKLAPIIRLLQKQRTDFFLIHTGQHYSYEMDRIFFRDLRLPEPAVKLGICSDHLGGHGHHTGKMLVAVEAVLLARRPRALLVQGDTNSVLAGSLAASKIGGCLLGHVEAGLRSYDRTMPEEINRVISDHISDMLFAPTPQARKILLGEGIAREKIYVTGNTIVDAVRQNLKIARQMPGKQRLGFERKKNYFLMTLHRQENVDDKNRLRSIFQGLELVSKDFKTSIVFPVHPRTAKRMRQFGLAFPWGVVAIPPAGFLEFLNLEAGARMILTDSGGLQEEACILKVPCVTLRTTTERPETVAVGANVIAGFHSEAIRKAAARMMRRKRNWPNPFGDGRAAERIVQLVKKRCV
jgi:UDP-N-acetylglucosamine 2-epimerase (non-hydrolysing)